MRNCCCLGVLALSILLVEKQLISRPPDFRGGINNQPLHTCAQAQAPTFPSYPLEESWKQATNVQTIGQQEQELYFLYSLASYQRSFWHEADLLPMLNQIKVLDQTYSSADLLVQHLFAKQDFCKIAELPIFCDLSEELSPDILLMGACAFDQVGKKSDADKCFAFLEKNFASNEQVIYQVATRLIKQEQYKNAVEKIDSFLSQANNRPKHAIFFTLKAYILANFLAQPQEAARVLEAGLELSPTNEKLLKLKFAFAAQGGLTDESLSVLQKLVNVSNDEGLRKTLIASYCQNKNYLRAFEEMQQLKSSDVEHVINKIVLLVKLQRYPEALREAENSLAQNPACDKLYNLYLQLLLESGRFDKLVNRLLADVEGDPGKQGRLIPKILLLVTQCQKQENIVKRLLKLKYKVTDVFLYMALADLCLSAGFYQYANHLYGILEPLFAQQPVLKAKILCATAKVYFSTGNQECGVELVRKALKICPNLFVGQRLLAEHYLKKQNLKLAERYARKAFMLNPVDKSLQALCQKLERLKRGKAMSRPLLCYLLPVYEELT